MSLLREKKGALFDLGSTLIEYENIPWNKMYELCLKRGHDFLIERGIAAPVWDGFLETYLKFLAEAQAESRSVLKEVDIIQLFKRLFGHYAIEKDESFYQEFLRAYYEPIRENVTLVDGAVQVLEHFRQNGHKLGLISNTVFPSEFHLQEMDHLGLRDYFDFTLFSSEFTYRKPHKAIFEETLRRLDILPSQAFFVGDRVDADVLGAKQMGIFSVLLLSKKREYDDLSLADLVIEDLRQLIDFY